MVRGTTGGPVEPAMIPISDEERSDEPSVSSVRNDAKYRAGPGGNAPRSTTIRVTRGAARWSYTTSMKEGPNVQAVSRTGAAGTAHPSEMALERPGSMSVEIVRLTTDQIAVARPEIMRVYAAAFGAAPYYRDQADAARFADMLDYQMRRRDFCFLAACTAGESENSAGSDLRTTPGTIAGFTYGYTGSQGQWWHDVVSSALTRDAVERWLEGSYELV